MNPFRRLLIWAAVRLGGLRVIRFVANIFEVKRNVNEHFSFPFIKRRRHYAAQILVYHRVNDEKDPIFPGVPTKIFAQQMEYLAENYYVCSLTEIVQRLQSDDLPANSLAITFDDGYRDNFSNAFPVLKNLRLPATIFLATDAIGTGRVLWHDRVFSAFRTTQLSALSRWDDAKQNYPLVSSAEKSIALDHFLRFLWSLDDEAKAEWIDRLVDRLAVNDQQLDPQLMLDWEHVKAMSAQNVEFGAHTVTHPILSKLSRRQVKQEIRISKEIIEANLKIPVKHFAYPVGRREDFTDGVKKVLRDAGFECAVTTIFGSNDAQQDLFELRRATPWDHDIDSFALRLSYFRFASC